MFGSAVAKLAELPLLITILFIIIVLPSFEAANPINFNYGMTKDIIDKEPDLAGKIYFFNLQNSQKPSNLDCETGYQAVMCMDALKLFEKALVVHGYPWISDYKSKVKLAGTISPSYPEFNCNHEMTKQITDEEQDLDGKICISYLEKHSILNCETNFQAVMCMEAFKLFEKALEDHGYSWISNYNSTIILPEEISLPKETSPLKPADIATHPLFIALLVGLSIMIMALIIYIIKKCSI